MAFFKGLPAFFLRNMGFQAKEKLAQRLLNRLQLRF
jgi:hypothetical protein